MEAERKEQIFSETRRRYRVADMSITMHSMLRDKYSKKATLLDITIFSISVIIAALAFSDPDLLARLPWNFGLSRLSIGALAIVIFIASVVAWRVDWKTRADAHGRAASGYTRVKFRLNEASERMTEDQLAQLLQEYEEVSRNAIPIPDSEFLRLKSEHGIKVRLSRVLDRWPAAGIRLIRLRMRIRHTIRAVRDKSEQDQQ